MFVDITNSTRVLTGAGSASFADLQKELYTIICKAASAKPQEQATDKDKSKGATLVVDKFMGDGAMLFAEFPRNTQPRQADEPDNANKGMKEAAVVCIRAVEFIVGSLYALGRDNKLGLLGDRGAYRQPIGARFGLAIGNKRFQVRADSNFVDALEGDKDSAKLAWKSVPFEPRGFGEKCTARLLGGNTVSELLCVV